MKLWHVLIFQNGTSPNLEWIALYPSLPGFSLIRLTCVVGKEEVGERKQGVYTTVLSTFITG